MKQRPVLIIMAKQPLPGRTKTRLCPPLTLEEATLLYEGMLRDTLALTQRVPGIEVVLGIDSPGSEAYFRGLAPDLRQLLQGDGALGDRLAHVSEAAFADGAPAVGVMSSDSPSLPPSYLGRAFALLEEYDLSIGPCEDGGYYMAALRQSAPRLFREVTMSTPHVLHDTLERAAELGLRTALLPAWYDIDTAADLERLRNDPAPLQYTRPLLPRL
ncbi:TIGR04282 family arsenosugar biosynthesis glycosyltransferase [Candidatus Chloroploca asiatica]|uniref:Glycosyltransferase n=1 Tax=Candidatus Chloroploca asiatica TaxID=1506545 RepID=A0A2H3L445_9CHLR|nr:TIGR04282 family arsenosugar biosynthesis glycosyltransferase [Candidatus Chloroploca asiatica]PDV99579.1 hypothetical protein A9Q02_11565 [Candidatus Chloroploca asiatica]